MDNNKDTHTIMSLNNWVIWPDESKQSSFPPVSNQAVNDPSTCVTMKLPLFPDCVVQEYHSVAMLEITQKLVAFESHVCSFSYHNINCGFHHLISSIKQVQIFAIKSLAFRLLPTIVWDPCKEQNYTYAKNNYHKFGAWLILVLKKLPPMGNECRRTNPLLLPWH